MKLVMAALSLLLSVACYQGGGGGGGAKPAPQPSPTTSMDVDCICEDSAGYINAHKHTAPWTTSGLKTGTVLTLTANSCTRLSACTDHALTGTVKMKLTGWTTNDYMIYKFTMHGPKQ